MRWPPPVSWLGLGLELELGLELGLELARAALAPSTTRWPPQARRLVDARAHVACGNQGPYGLGTDSPRESRVGLGSAAVRPLARAFDTGSPIGDRLQKAQRKTINALFVRACAPEGSAVRAGLPARCTREWFCNTFCNGLGKDRTGDPLCQHTRTQKP